MHRSSFLISISTDNFLTQLPMLRLIRLSSAGLGVHSREMKLLLRNGKSTGTATGRMQNARSRSRRSGWSTDQAFLTAVDAVS
jgi:hypothetical protein